MTVRDFNFERCGSRVGSRCGTLRRMVTQTFVRHCSEFYSYCIRMESGKYTMWPLVEASIACMYDYADTELLFAIAKQPSPSWNGVCCKTCTDSKRHDAARSKPISASFPRLSAMLCQMGPNLALQGLAVLLMAYAQHHDFCR